jgi:hypothetical protein
MNIPASSAAIRRTAVAQRQNAGCTAHDGLIGITVPLMGVAW